MAISKEKLKTHNLKRLYALIAKQWHPEMNGDLTAKDVSPTSGKRVWRWCKNGHEWQAVVSSRAYGTGCRLCYLIVLREGF
ncbi:MAG: zinc-ribbon domain-containing protein [Spirochaetales bacterium]|nr:zinc-ribbon domain-containing protein [Spirochaetales bacterium]